MPLYDFRCQTCGVIEESFPMADVPAAVTCPDCCGSARRQIGAAGLHRQSAAKSLVESTERTAHEPPVVSSLPHTKRAPQPRITRNPLHAKLPRP